MATVEEYKLREAEFMARTDALCEVVNPLECDCTRCPCKEQCDFLNENDPFSHKEAEI